MLLLILLDKLILSSPEKIITDGKDYHNCYIITLDPDNVSK